MGIRALQNLKKDNQQKRENIFTRHMVYGDDIFALDLYERLKKQYGESEVALFAGRSLQSDESQVQDFLPMGPSTFRGEDNLNCLQDQFPSVRLESSEKPSLFYKEGTLRQFGGRSKSEKLLWGEEFYTQAKGDIPVEDWSELFSCLKNEELINELSKSMIEEIPMKIVKTESQDLVENAQWTIHTGSGRDYSCEHLYWAESPQRFLDFYENKNELSDDFIEFAEKTSGPSSLFIHLHLSKPVVDQKETIFSPLSFTHEWGHVIGDFYANNGEDEHSQVGKFVTFIDRNHTSEAEISKKIRLFKRNLEKIFPQILDSEEREIFSLKAGSMCSKIDDELFERCRGSVQNVHFAGPNAPLAIAQFDRGSQHYDTRKLSHVVRGVMSIRFLMENV